MTYGFCGFLLLLGGGGGGAGWVGAGFCCLLCLEIMMSNSIYSTQYKTKGPSSDQAVVLDVLLSSLKYEMSGTSQGRGLYSVIWIPILGPDYRYRPTKTIIPVNHYTTGHVKNIPDPTSCRDVHHVLSVIAPSCRGFHYRLSIFAPFFP